jgi:hypothetical protein
LDSASRDCHVASLAFESAGDDSSKYLPDVNEIDSLNGETAMLNRLVVTGFGLLFAGSLSAKELAEEDLGAAPRQTESAVSIEAADAPVRPAWQEPGFVMDEVIATAESAPLDLPAVTPVSPDLKELLELHRAVRDLIL